MNKIHPEVILLYMDNLRDEIEAYCAGRNITWIEFPEDALPAIRLKARNITRTQCIAESCEILRRLI